MRDGQVVKVTPEVVDELETIAKEGAAKRGNDPAKAADKPDTERETLLIQNEETGDYNEYYTDNGEVVLAPNGNPLVWPREFIETERPGPPTGQPFPQPGLPDDDNRHDDNSDQKFKLPPDSPPTRALDRKTKRSLAEASLEFLITFAWYGALGFNLLSQGMRGETEKNDQ